MEPTETKTETPTEGRGRSAKKREAKAVEQLALRMVDLPETEIAKLELSPDLDKELQLARNTRGFSSRKRQIKHLAGFLRRDDDQRTRIEAILDRHSLEQHQEGLQFHNLEELRDRICDPENFAAAMDDVRERYPHLDAKKLAGLARSVHDNRDKKAYREIFRRLRKATEDETES